MTEKAVILLSGGVDSLTCLAIAKQAEFECYGLAIDYGQKHGSELSAAKYIAEKYDCKEFRIAKVDLGHIPGAALTDQNEAVPDYSEKKAIKSTYFPARNTIFLSLALAWAESLRATKIFFGANLADYHGFPDARLDYLEAFTNLARLATRTGRLEDFEISIETPLLKLDKTAIIRHGLELGLDYSLAVTCYQATKEGEGCGHCDSCVIRKNAFIELGLNDPTKYV